MAFIIRPVFNILWGYFQSKNHKLTNDYQYNSRVNIFDIDMFLHMNHAQYLVVCILYKF
jgi:acyl-ACP thioesterase